MASDDRRKNRPVGELIFSEGHRFDFFQAVKLLECFAPAAASLGVRGEPHNEAFRIKSRVNLEFPASPIFEIVRASADTSIDSAYRRLHKAFENFSSAVSFEFESERDTSILSPPPLAEFRQSLAGSTQSLRDFLTESRIAIHRAYDRARETPLLDAAQITDLMASFEEALAAIQSIEFALDKKSAVEMTVSFMGLAGWHGPLPIPYTEELIARANAKDFAAIDFLDMFNHRLVSLHYCARKLTSVGSSAAPPDEDDISRILYSCAGLGSPALRNRMAIPDRALLRYAGLIAWEPHSLVGLRVILADYFHVPVQIDPCVGEWLELQADQWTTLGAAGRQNTLGVTSMLGRRVWNQQSKFRIHVGPLSFSQFLQFLPVTFPEIQPAFSSLIQFTRFFIGYEVNFDIRLELNASESSGSRLGDAKSCRLGWTSSLDSGRQRTPAKMIVLNPTTEDDQLN